MTLQSIDSFLVRPARGVPDHEQLAGYRLPNTGRLFQVLDNVFQRASDECRIEIIFRADPDGSQRNDCQSLLMKHLRHPTPTRALALAQRLAERTGNSSGLGLLFVMCGFIAGAHRAVLSRFPADQGVLAEQRGNALAVEFIEKVFMKSANAYKSAVYSTTNLEVDIWRGRAIDKQINGPREVSEYWIGDFLSSDLATTGAAGTRRLGDAIRRAARSTDSEEVRAKLIAAAQLIPGKAGRRVTARGILASLGMPDEGIAAVQKAMGRPELMDERFQVNAEEFAKAATYRSVELDNGAVLIAETRRFETVFNPRRIAEGRTTYSTEGIIVNERLRKQL